MHCSIAAYDNIAILSSFYYSVEGAWRVIAGPTPPPLDRVSIASSQGSSRGQVIIFIVTKRSCRHPQSHQEVVSSSSVSSRGLVIIFIIFKIIKTFYLCWVGSGVDVILIIYHPLVLLSSRGSVIIFVGLSFLSVLIWWSCCHLCK